MLLPLSGLRLRLRAWRADEADDVMGLLGSAATMGNMQAGGRLLVHSEEEAARWLQRRRQQQENGGLTMWAVDSVADGVLVGACGVFPEGAELELAYVISHRHRGQHYAAEAARLVFEGLDAAGIVSPVFATIAPDNVASRRVAEDLGLRRTDERTDDRGTVIYRRG